MKNTVTTKEELIGIWDRQTPVKYQSPNMPEPIITTVRSIISVNEDGRKFTEIELRDGKNCRVQTIPRYITLLSTDELYEYHKSLRSPELVRLLEEAEKNREAIAGTEEEQ